MQSRRELTATSGAQFLVLSFETLTPFLDFVPSSTSRDEFYLLDDQCILEIGHLGCQSLDLGPSPRLPAEQFLP